EKSLALAREIGDRRGEAIATGHLGSVCRIQGRREEARAQFERRLALAREIGDRSGEGHVLDSLASLKDGEGNAGTAVRLCGEALALLRKLGERGAAAETLVAMGAIELRQDDHESAIAHLEEALSLSQEVKQPKTILLATVHRARLPGRGIEPALAALEEHEQRVPHDTKTECRYRLWELAEDKAHLAEAKRLLDFAVEQSPDEYRDSMIENVPLHRDIMRAWEGHGGEGASRPAR
ncbi:MAG: tetratricopeptide repeat protein, partial [Planctomycetota bacterium]